jgi:hypothetical protein
MSLEGSKVRSALWTVRRIVRSNGSISTRLLQPSSRLPAHRSVCMSCSLTSTAYNRHRDSHIAALYTWMHHGSQAQCEYREAEAQRVEAAAVNDTLARRALEQQRAAREVQRLQVHDGRGLLQIQWSESGQHQHTPSVSQHTRLQTRWALFLQEQSEELRALQSHIAAAETRLGQRLQLQERSAAATAARLDSIALDRSLHEQRADVRILSPSHAQAGLCFFLLSLTL